MGSFIRTGVHVFSVMAFGVLVAGCASPRYETTYRYESSASAEGQACIKGCEASQNACRTECQAAWKACAERVEPQVDERYAQALKAYAEDLRLYRSDLDRYHWDLWVGWSHGGSGLWYSPWPYHPWPGYYPAYFPPSPAPGDPPTKDTVRGGLLKAQCNDDCGCQAKYDTCFEGCGGRVVTETRCVADCPRP